MIELLLSNDNLNRVCFGSDRHCIRVQLIELFYQRMTAIEYALGVIDVLWQVMSLILLRSSRAGA